MRPALDRVGLAKKVSQPLDCSFVLWDVCLERNPADFSLFPLRPPPSDSAPRGRNAFVGDRLASLRFIPPLFTRPFLPPGVTCMAFSLLFLSPHLAVAETLVSPCNPVCPCLRLFNIFVLGGEGAYSVSRFVEPDVSLFFCGRWQRSSKRASASCNHLSRATCRALIVPYF